MGTKAVVDLRKIMSVLIFKQRSYLIAFLLALFVFFLLIGSFNGQNFIFFVSIDVALLIFIINTLGITNDAALPPELASTNNIETALSSIHELITRAEKNLIIVSGSLREEIWNNGSIVKDLDFLSNNGVQITILCGKEIRFSYDSEIAALLKKLILNGALKLYAIEKTPKVHFIIVDNAHIRIEENHTEEFDNRKANIVYYGSRLVVRAKQKFERYRLKSIRITIDNFEDFVQKKLEKTVPDKSSLKLTQPDCSI